MKNDYTPNWGVGDEKLLNIVPDEKQITNMRHYYYSETFCGMPINTIYL